ncbi:MAG: UDP-glucose--hexose-1-phosphate uridylyltransferase [Armatimonadetes bacterium]|nr:UDP-glucose--hexose-1-phosphate uridylyltransferase [Armatimonadota bacterium]
MIDGSHRRKNVLTGEWVVVSPHRTQRPWLGQEESATTEPGPEYDSTCTLCPGNTRASGAQNPDYRGAWWFRNDFPAFDLQEGAAIATAEGPFPEEKVYGECRVLCYSHRHNAHLVDLSHEERLEVIEMWKEQLSDLGPRYEWVQIFENRGAMMGASNPHPHGQVWAMSSVPTLVEREMAQAKATPRLFRDYLQAELEAGERIVIQNDHWVAWVPFAATWPFETMLAPLYPAATLLDLDPAATDSLADALQRLIRIYDRVFGVPFPYSMGWHNAPRGWDADDWQVHAHFYPPLLRSATVRKHMVGFEMLAEAQRDLTPEAAAAHLRGLL